jgi:hypothetical protein
VSVRVLEHDLGLTWVVEEPLERASHALTDGARVWVVDPVDDREAVQRASALGAPVAVVGLLDRHERDGASVARRLGVPYLRRPGRLAGSPFDVVPVLGVRGWRESALWWGQRRALVVAEVVGTSPHVTLGGSSAAAIHPLLRLRPPGALRGYEPQHLLPGHGEPLHGTAAADALRDAYARSRRDIPRILLGAPRLVRAAREQWR